MRRMLIVMAMRAEARPLLGVLGASRLPPPAMAGPLPAEWYGARRLGMEVVVAVAGEDPFHRVDAIGTDAAALVAFVALSTYAPDLVVSAGTSGGWSRQGTEVADVFVSRDRFVHHDRRIDLPGFAAYGVGDHPAVDADGLADALGLRQGVVTTGNSLDESPEDAERILASGAAVKDMEAATVAGVARLFDVPVMAIKAVTDLVDHHADTAEQFQANLATASKRLCDTMVAVVEWCAPRSIAELGGAR